MKTEKLSIFISIVLISLLALGAVSAADDTAATDDAPEASIEEVQTIDNTITNDDMSYESSDIIVNTTGDSGDLDKDSKANLASTKLSEGETSSFTDLANNINNAPSYLSLSGNYAYDSTIDGDYVTGIYINKDITINGGGTTTIDGRNVARIFNISNGHNVVLLDITFTNGNIEQGGAIYNDGNLVLKDCEFASNAAQYGGAIYNTENGVITGDSDFTENIATYRGGAIYSEGSVALSDSVIDGNDITYRAKNDDNGGAAIYNNGGTLTLDKVQVTNNLLDIVIRDGNDGHLINAAIFTSGDATITDSVISNNSGSWGGGIYVTNGATLDVSGTTFEKNMATFGAAIYDEGAKVIVNNCDFNENHCEGIGSAGTSSTQAAAILVMSEGASATITNSRFNKNSAKTGGAVSISQASGDVLIEGCTFTENTASYEGGAIYNYAADGAELTVKGSTFTDNTAANWGDAISNDAGLKLEGNTITGDVNTAIGNWFGTIDTQVKVKILDGQEHTVTNPTIDLTATVTDDNGNKINDHAFTFTVGAEEVPATYDATEGIYKATYTFKNPGTYTVSTDSYTLEDVTDSVITFKSSLSSLKALIDENTNGTLDLTYGFSYDDELDSAIKISGIAINKDITINGNGVTLSGADVARLFEINSGFTLTLNNLIISNFVSNYGPAAYVHNGATLNSNNVNYNNNIANANGGAIYSEYGNLVIIGSTFTNNEAKGTYGTSTGVGSAIYDFAGINPGTTTYITDSTFTNNAGTGTKAGVYVDNAVITGSTFTNTVIFAMRKASISNDVFDNEGNDIHLSTNTGFVFYDGTGDLPVLSKATINYTGTSFQGLQDIITNSDYGTKTLNIGLHNDITKLADEEFANGIVIDKKVLINGLGHTLDVNGQGKAFYISEGAELSLLDMNIVGDGTSAIVNDGILKDYNPTKPITFTNAGEYPIDNDEGIITINFNTKTFTQLNSVISLISGGTINTSSTKVTKGDDEKETFADGITITQKDLSIISSNKNYQRTIDADNSGRIFNVADGASLTLKNINLQNGNAADGGAVYVSEGAKLFADSTKFLNNKATYSGGAIYATGATVSLDNCILDNNDATDHSTNNDTGGAAIYAEDSTVTISKTKVTNNGDKTLNRSNGDLINGVLNLHDSTTTITDSVFENNTGIYGGAITAETTKDEGVSKLTISGTNFTSNAAYTGGAVYVADTEFDISDSIFDANNKASGEGSTGYTAGGGALVIMSGSEGTLDNVTVKNSHASQGGAIDLENSQVTITGSKFESNSADGWAGAIYATGNSALTVEDSSFKDNTAAAATIVTFGATTATIKDSNFTDNYDTYSWGVVTVYGTGDVNIEGSKFTKDVDGTYTVDVYVVDDAKVSVKDSTFDTNSYYSIVAEDGKLTLEGNDINSDYVPIYTVADAKIVSTVKAKILANDTYNWHMAGYEITSTLTDDKGNVIRDANFNFVITAEGMESITLPASFNGTEQVYKATFTPASTGTYLVNLDYPVEEVQTSVVIFSRSLIDLKNIIDNDEDGIVDLDGDYAYIAEFDESIINGIVIDKAVTINGNNFEICGKNHARLFNVTETGSLSLKDTTICHGSAADYGAGIYSEGALTINDCNFTENTITGGTAWAPGAPCAGGAAIFATKGDLKVTGTDFTKNTAVKDQYNTFTSGAVYAVGASSVKIDGCTFTENEAVYGAGVTLEDLAADKAIISNSVFKDNIAWQGGAININEKVPTVTITGCNFTNNNAVEPNIGSSSPRGGAISVGTNAYSTAVTMDGCVFDSNSAVLDGGAIVFNGDSTASITNTNFTKNSAKIGGSIAASNAITVKESSFIDNDADWYAAGIYAINGLNIDNVAFTDNEINYFGGALYIQQGTANINNANFTNNKAVRGGAIYVAGGTTTISKSRFSGNDPEYGGAIFVAAGEVIAKENTEFTKNTADLGGAVFVASGATFSVDAVKFTENTATQSGGAIYSEGSVSVKESEFNKNTVTNGYAEGTSQGAAISSNGGAITVEDSTFTQNKANPSSWGIGTVYVNGSDVSIKGTTFKENEAFFGGAIFFENIHQEAYAIDNCTFESNKGLQGGAINIQTDTAGTVAINNAKFIENSAYSTGTGTTYNDMAQGGAITAAVGDINLIITESEFTKNTAVSPNSVPYAGAVYYMGLGDGDLTIDNCQFTENEAQFGGAVLYYNASNSELTVSYSKFTDNTATSYGGAIIITGTATIDNVEFVKNTAQYGGAIFLSGADATIKNSLFENNNGVAKAFNIYRGATDTLTLTDNTFKTLVADNVTVDADKDTYAYGETVTISGTFDWGVTRTAIDVPFTFSKDGQALVGAPKLEGFIAGDYEKELTDLTPGYYTIGIATFTDADGNQYIIDDVTDSFTIEKATPTITVVAEDTDRDALPAEVTVTVTDVNDDPIEGLELVVIVDGEEYPITTNASGQYAVEVSDLVLKNYTAVAFFAGDDVYTSAYGTDDFRVTAVPDVIVTIGSVKYGEENGIEVILVDGDTKLDGVVEVAISGIEDPFVVAVADGYGYLELNPEDFDVNTYTYTAIARENGNYVQTEPTEAKTFTVSAGELIVDFESTQTVTGQPIAGTIEITDENGGDVKVTDVTVKIYEVGGTEPIAEISIDEIDGTYDLVYDGELVPGEYTLVVAIPDQTNYPAVSKEFELVVEAKSAEIGVDLDEIDIEDGQTTTIRITVGEGQVWAFTSYGDEDGEIEYSTGTVLVIEEGDEWTKVRVLTNDADESYVGQEFYIRSDARFWGTEELYSDEGETFTGIYINAHPAGVVPADIDGVATITIKDNEGNVVQVIEDVQVTDGKADYELPVLPIGEYYFTVSVEAEGYDLEDADFYDYLVVFVKEGTYKDLQQRINEAIAEAIENGDETAWIDLPYDFAYDADYDGAEFINGVTIPYNLYIEGNMRTISGSELARIFYIGEDVSVEINLATFEDGSIKDNGGAIYSAGYLTVHDSLFRNNKVTESTTWAPGSPAAGGAAIYSAPGSRLDMWNNEFINNEALHGLWNSFTCGAVYASGAEYVSIRDSKFTGNAAVLGGAVTIEFYHVDEEDQDEATIYNCDFIDNIAWQGGAVNINEDVPYLNIADSRFNGNKAVDPNSGSATPTGGAISVGTGSYGTELVLNNCGFLGNTATSSGGAITLMNPVCELYADNCDFESNTATYGGAIYFYGSEAVITNTNFASNDPDYGGALFIATGDVSLDNVEFSENSADYGGAIYLANGASLDIANARFYDNVATNRGGAIFAAGTLTVKDTDFERNSITEREANVAGQETGGAAIYLSTSGEANVKDTRFKFSNPDYELGDKVYGAVLVAGTAEFDNCNFEDNKARWGAAIGVNGDIGATGAAYAKVTSSYFARNEGVQGGAVHIENASMDIGNCDFDANTVKVATGAYAQGAAIYVNGGKFDIAETSFRNGNSEQNSGAIHVFQEESFGDSTITNCNFDDNYAGLYYGAIYFYAPEDSLTITGSNFNNNKAEGVQVGAVAFMGKDLTISGTNFINNEAPNYGAVYFYTYSDEGKLAITDSSFRNNKATGYNGALFIYNGEATIDNTQFAYNEGSMIGGIWNYAATLTVTNSLFEENSGRANMFNIYTQTGTTTITGTTFKTIRDVTINVEDSYVYGADVSASGNFDWGVNKYPIDMKYTVDSVEGTTTAQNARYTADLGNEFAVGNHTIVIKSFTDAEGNYYVVDAVEKTFTVTKASPVITITGDSIEVGEDAEIDVTVMDGETGVAGIAVVTVNGVNYAVTIGEDGTGALTISDLAYGEYPITAKFVGNDDYEAVDYAGDAKVVVDSDDVTFDIVIENITYGEGLVVIVENATDAAGNLLSGMVMGNIENATGQGAGLIVYVTDGQGTRTYTGLTAGDYEVSATFVDEDYELFSEMKVFTVNVAQAKPTVSVTYADGDITITLDGVNGEKLNETVAVAIDGTPLDIAAVTENGTFTFTPDSTPGTHLVEVEFAGNHNYLAGSDYTTFEVPKATPVITVTGDEISLGETATVTVTVMDGETAVAGIAVVTVDGVDYAVTIGEEGTGTVDIKGLEVDSYDITAKFIANDNYEEAVYVGDAKVVVLASTELTIDVEPEDLVYGADAIINVTVTDGDGVVIPVDKVNVTVNGETKEYDVVDGQVNLGELPAGETPITVSYVDDTHELATAELTLNVAKAGMTFNAITSPVVYRDDLIVEITDAATADNDPVSGTVTVYYLDNEGQERSATGDITDGNGQVKLTDLDAGVYDLIIVFNNESYEADAGEMNGIVLKADPELTVTIDPVELGEKIAVELELRGYHEESVDEKVNLTINGQFIGEYTTVNGKVSFEIDNDLNISEYVAIAQFAGNDNYNAAVGTAVFKVTKATPVVTVEGAKVEWGEPATIKVTVTDSEGMPIEGTAVVRVSWVVNGTDQYIDIVEGSGEATFEISGLVAPGEYDVTVFFLGGRNYNDVNNTDAKLVLTTPAAVNLNVNADAGEFGEDTNITVTLTDTAHNPMEGSVVTVYVDDKELTNATIGEDGTVTVPVSDLTAGDHTVKVVLDDGVHDLAEKEISFTVDPTSGANIKFTGEDVEFGNNYPIKITVVDPEDNPLDGKALIVLDGNQLAEVDIVAGAGEYNITGLDVGSYYLEVIFNNDNYLPTNYGDKINVTRATPTVKVEDAEVEWGTPATIKVTVYDSEGMPIEGNAVVSVSWIVDGVDQYIDITEGSGEANFEISGFVAPGEYDVTVFYLAGRNYNNASATAKLTLTAPKDINVDVDVDAGDYGEDTNVTVTVTDKANAPVANAPVTVVVDGKEYNATTDENGTVTVPVSGLEAGDHNITVKVDDGVHTPAEETATATVDPASGADIQATVEPGHAGQDSIVNVSAKDPEDNPVKGNAIVIVDGEPYVTVPLDENGTASVPIKDLPTGEHTVEVTLDNPNYLPSSYTTHFDVKAQETNLVVTVDKENIVYGDGAVTATIGLSADGKPINGVVEVLLNGNPQSVNVVNGLANVKFDNLAAGNYTVVADFAATSVYAGASDSTNFNVERKATKFNYENMKTTAVNPNIDGRIGEYFYFQLVDEDGKALANKSVQIGFNGKVYNKTTNETGWARLQINLARVFRYTFAINFAGDENYTSTFNVALINVTAQAPKLTTSAKSYAASAKSKTLTATFKTKSGNAVSGRKITFTVNGKSYSAKTNTKGVATVKVSISKKGTYNFTAKFAGDDTYAAASKSAKLTIK